MKVINVGNANYANSRQQNFGMNTEFTAKAKRLIQSDSLIGKVERAVTNLRTKSGRNKRVIIDRYSDFRYLMFRDSRRKMIGDALLLEPRATLATRIISSLKQINRTSGTVLYSV